MTFKQAVFEGFLGDEEEELSLEHWRMYRLPKRRFDIIDTDIKFTRPQGGHTYSSELGPRSRSQISYG